VYYYFEGPNPSGATLTYAAKTGLFKGSFKLYHESYGTPWGTKIFSVPYTGVMVPVNGKLQGIGAGTVVIDKQKHGIPVAIR